MLKICRQSCNCVSGIGLTFPSSANNEKVLYINQYTLHCISTAPKKQSLCLWFECISSFDNCNKRQKVALVPNGSNVDDIIFIIKHATRD